MESKDLKAKNLEKIETETYKYIAIFTVTNKVGSLLEVLEILKKTGANMTKIESKPIPDKPWEYKFYVEFVGNEKFDLDELKHHTSSFDLIGMFSV